MNRLEIHGQRQLGVNLTNWNTFANFNPDYVGEYQEIIGYSITPTLNANDFYPASGNPINIVKPGLYNLKVSFQLTGTGISGTTGIIAFGSISYLFNSSHNFLYLSIATVFLTKSNLFNRTITFLIPDILIAIIC